MRILLLLGLIATTLGCNEQTQKATEAVKKSSQQAIQRGKEMGKTAFIKGRELAELSMAEIQQFAVEIRDEYGDDVQRAGEHVNGLLDAIAHDPTEELSQTEKIGRMVVLMVPLVGPTKRYSDARKLYEKGVAEDNEADIQQARRQCLLACAEAGLDIGTLGAVGGKIDLVATGADRVLAALKLSRNLNVLVGEDIRILDGLLDSLLEEPAIRSGMDDALSADFATMVQPADASS